MTRDSIVDQVLDSWFTEGPTELPDRTVAAIADRLDDVRQRGPFGLPRRFAMGRTLAALGGAAVLIVAGVMTLSFYLNGLRIGVGPSPTPSRAPSTAVPSPQATAAGESPLVTSGTWTRVIVDAALRGSHITEIAAGPRGLVAIASDTDGAPRLFFSTDGRDWSLLDGPSVGDSLVASDRGFLMVGDDGAWASEDGLEWRRVATNWAGDPDTGGSIVTNATAGGPGYVAVGNHNSIWTSSDGSAWARAQVPPVGADLITPEFPDLTVDIFEVGAVGEHLVATGRYFVENSDASGPGGQSLVLASSGGPTWSTVLPDVGDRGVPRLGAGPGAFILIGGPLDGEDTWRVWRSADGQAWAKVADYNFGAGSNNEIHVDGVAAAAQGYLAFGRERECFSCPTRSRLWTSVDGRSWSAPADEEFFGLRDAGMSIVAVGTFGSRFVVGGQFGGLPAIWISQP